MQNTAERFKPKAVSKYRIHACVALRLRSSTAIACSSGSKAFAGFARNLKLETETKNCLYKIKKPTVLSVCGLFVIKEYFY